MKKSISGRLLTAAILDTIKNLPLPHVIQIRDLCNETISREFVPTQKEPEEFKTWKVRDSSGGIGLYSKNMK